MKMKTKTARGRLIDPRLVVLILTALVALPASAADGDLEPSLAILEHTLPEFGGEDFPCVRNGLSLVRQSTGKIVAVGAYCPLADHFRDVAVFRFDPATGAFDTSFGGGDGMMHIQNDWAPNDLGRAVALQSVGGDPDYIVVAGFWWEPEELYMNFLVARVTPDGVLDTSFGSAGTGIVSIDFVPGDTDNNATSLAVDSATGHIVVAGDTENDLAVALLDPDGLLVPGFGSGGLLVLDASGGGNEARAATFAPDGNILLAGKADYAAVNGFMLVKLDLTGALVPGFGSGGVLIPDIAGPITDVEYVGTDILAYGYGGGNLKFAKFDSSGNLYDGVAASPEFGSGGLTEVDFGVDLRSSSMQVDGAGAIWGAGYRQSNGDYVLTRLHADGALDLGFGGARYEPDDDPGDPRGKVVVAKSGDVPGYNDVSTVGLLLESGGSVVLGGLADTSAEEYKGYSLVRVQANGDIDLSISDPGGGSGAIEPVDRLEAWATAPDGSIVAVGHRYWHETTFKGFDGTFVRFGPGGLLDGSWGRAGVHDVASPDAGTTGFDYLGHVRWFRYEIFGIHSIDIARDGKLLVAGTAMRQDLIGTYFSFVGRYHPDGSLDETFGHADGDGMDGWTLIDVNPPLDTHLQVFYDVHALPDGGVLACGNTVSWATESFYLTLARFNPDGSLDTNFAAVDDGVEDIPGIYSLIVAAGNDYPKRILVDHAGRILVVGGTGQQGADDGDSFVVRFTADGVPDTSFGGGDGIVIHDLSTTGNRDSAFDAALLPDGRILLAGTASYDYKIRVARIDGDGNLDSSFGGGDGVAKSSVRSDASRFAVQPDGKIVVPGGTNEEDPKVVRFNEDGTLDLGFGTDGVVEVELNVAPAMAAIVADSKILLAGHYIAARLDNTDLGEPEIDIQRPAGSSIPSGGSDDIGVVDTHWPSLSYTIDNSAGADLLMVSDISASNLVNVDNFSVDMAMPVAAAWGQKVTVVVTLQIIDNGSFGLDLNISSNDADEGAYQISVSGEAAGLGDAEIDIQCPTGASIPSGGSDDVGVVTINPVSLYYTIDNSAGTDLLMVSDISASNLRNIDGFVVYQTMPLVVPQGGEAAVEASFDFIDNGSFGLDLTITNSDPDEGSYQISVSGGASEPVLMPDGPELRDDLRLWLRGDDLCAAYGQDDEVATWPDASGRGNHAVALAGSQEPLFGLDDLPVLNFSDFDWGELMSSPATFGSKRLDLTIFAVYSTEETEPQVRPVGFGCWNLGDTADNFNLAVDPSIRMDNGSITGHTLDHPRGEFFVRVASMDHEWNIVQEHFDGELALDSLNSFRLGTGDFYIGDLKRAGGSDNFDLAEVIVYRRLLTDLERRSVEYYLEGKYRSTMYLRFDEGEAAQQVAAGAGEVLDHGFSTNDAEAIATTANLAAYSGDVAMDPVPRTESVNSLSLELERDDGQLLIVPDDASLDLTAGFTIEAWVKLETLADDSDGLDESDQQALVAKEMPWVKRQGDNTSYIFLVQAGDLASWATHGSGDHSSLLLVLETDPVVLSVVSSLQITDNRWHYVQVSFDPAADEVRFTVDGRMETVSGVGGGGHANDFDLVVGARPTTATGVYTALLDGLVDELRFTDRPLYETRLLSSGAYIFTDGFESGGTSAWSAVVP